ncbi:MAG: hypothetical protein IH945_10280 [Armatimonadetes bacterium]|nr:hypothetical protein [Armatimonadota bacterium]
MLVLVGALLAPLAGCAVEVLVDDEAESDQLDIEIGRQDYVNGESSQEEQL